MAEKPKILIVIDEIPSPCWNFFASEYTFLFVRDGLHAEKVLQEQRFDIIFLDIFLFGMDGLQLLRYIRDHALCPFVILTSETPSFQYAREGILCGACDYLLRPFQQDTLQNALSRIQKASSKIAKPQNSHLLHMLYETLGTERFTEQLQHTFDRLQTAHTNSLDAEYAIQEGYWQLIQHAFDRYPWLSLYLSHSDCDIHRLNTAHANMVRECCETQAIQLNQLLLRLYPKLEKSKLTPIMQYMLAHVDDALSQKEVAAHFFMSSSALSSYFAQTTLESYRLYHQELRMSRAEYLLRHTEMKLYEICEKLCFRDVNYFSRLFKKRNGTTVSDYRNTDTLEFQI